MRFRRQQSRRRGAAAVEFAILAIPMVILLTGVWEVGRLIEAHNILTNAAREGGRQASTGVRGCPAVQASIETYLARNGIDNTGMTYTFENLTNPGLDCPTQAEQLDHFRMTVSLPFDNVKWALISQITPTTTMSVTVHWYSMKDIPLAVSPTVPVE